MHTPAFFRSRSFFNTYPVGEVVRSLFFSSILWMLLAIILYAVSPWLARLATVISPARTLPAAR